MVKDRASGVRVIAFEHPHSKKEWKNHPVRKKY